MDNSLLHDEVIELTLAYQRGESTEEERARLERLLLDHTRAVDIYLSVIADTVTLREAAGAMASGKSPLAVMADGSAPSAAGSPGVESPAAGGPGRSRSGRLWGAWVLAACLSALVAGGVWTWSTAHESVASHLLNGGVDSARIVSMSNVEWPSDAPQYVEWSFVPPESNLQFESGVLDLFLSNGAELQIKGPADVDFVSLERVVVRRGKLAARVGPGAVGLEIDTPHAQVIDRGTSFGISVDDEDRTSVAVYEGIVDLDVLGGELHPQRRLRSGEALRVDHAGRMSRITTVRNEEFLPPPRLHTGWSIAEPVIATVTDNVQSMQTAKYYRVIAGGFREDCRAYVDRQHQWNSLNTEGLPPFLQGGDYVMTFNDDKITAEIEIAVNLNQPASIYVLLDDRVTPPEWLERDFVDTQWDVGADEGYTDREEKETAAGPGMSIDHVCSVWRRDVPKASTVVLGALSKEAASVPARNVEQSMYGIVATPLRRGR